jgi:hypothetical protein
MTAMAMAVPATPPFHRERVRRFAADSDGLRGVSVMSASTADALKLWSE